MDATRHITLGIRSQAAIVVALAVLWWMSLFHDPFFACPNLFWIGIAYFFPFILPVFLAILLVSHRRAARPHRWLVRLAMLAAISPWLLFLVLFVGSV